jgi:hypothetical protein
MVPDLDGPNRAGTANPSDVASEQVKERTVSTMSEIRQAWSEDQPQPVALVIMSANPHLQPIYLKVIKPVLVNKGYLCLQGIEIVKSGIITEQTQEAVDGADLVVCDLTYGAFPVYYLLGIAHALQKPTIVLSQEGGTFPFNTTRHRPVIYRDEKFSLLELKETLLGLLGTVQATRHDPHLAGDVPPTALEIETARAALYDHNVDAQRYAVHFLRDCKDKDSYDKIKSLTQSHNPPDLIRDAFVGLYHVDPDRALRDLLSDRGVGNGDHYVVREAVVGLLGNYEPTKELLTRVRQLAQDWSWGVRMAVCQVLGKWGATAALGLLKDKLSVDPEAPVRAVAEEAIEAIRRSAARRK